MSALSRPQPSPAATPATPSASQARAGGIDSRALLGNASEVAIIHGGATYRLRATRQGKLILTK